VFTAEIRGRQSSRVTSTSNNGRVAGTGFLTIFHQRLTFFKKKVLTWVTVSSGVSYGRMRVCTSKKPQKKEGRKIQPNLVSSFNKRLSVTSEQPATSSAETARPN